MVPQKTGRRIILKLSGELLLGGQSSGIDLDACVSLARALGALQRQGFEIGIVLGGGNLLRGASIKSHGLVRPGADYLGMLATLLNGATLEQTLRALGLSVKLMSALECPKVACSFDWKKATQWMSEGTLLIFAGGTGNPYFTTDTAAALRALEVGADVLVKSTKVGGIYDHDPLKDSTAKRYERISYSEVLAQKLGIMDATAVVLCRENHIPVYVHDMRYLFSPPEEAWLFRKEYGTWMEGN